ncbi:(2Fe-2S)-binding protein [Hymenobacter sp. BT188]|uniref:(2Fe-2S)-binding protein n=1 Tax=Hymenobacter sp. BT188 TaxID=2763504 RepID=UPI00165162D0|nr:(2Fe-2S)-binding protein [Hymenobacter sp. BT188]MBC6607651.1 (2Fe-2S)-binding protein [Hymenobacter sp. BT188]
MKDPEENSEQNAGAGRGLSRRGFLKGAGITAAGGVLMTSGIAGLAEAEAAPAPDTVGPGRTSITLKINGDKKKVAIEPRQTLAEVLRAELNLTGTKVVCDRGACSACTVWLDNMPVNSCMTLAIEVGKREITTIEGLAKNGKLHPVQEAFVAHDASMCGFCTPGMVMSCASLLQRNPKPTLDDVKTATSGNLCRCGTYPKVFEATLAAAGIAYSQTQAQAAKG